MTVHAEGETVRNATRRYGVIECSEPRPELPRGCTIVEFAEVSTRRLSERRYWIGVRLANAAAADALVAWLRDEGGDQVEWSSSIREMRAILDDKSLGAFLFGA